MKQAYSLSLSPRNKETLAKCRKMLERLHNKLNNGSFVKLSERHRQGLIRRIRRYVLRLQKSGLKLPRIVAGFTLTFSLALVSPAGAQITFVKQNIAPLNEVDVGHLPIPCFIDIDGDGDEDVFIGENDGAILYFKNDGTSSSPQFEKQMGMDNPFDGVNVGYTASPSFVDIDGDGDQDVFVGEFYGTIRYFKNEGTNMVPQFVEQMGTANPMNGMNNAGSLPIPRFVDIDGDGDEDVFVGENEGIIRYYKNEGTNMSPQLVEQIGSSNPFDEVDVSFASVPSFVDLDEDGDQDAFVGEYYGTILYFENKGTDTSPLFVEQIDAANPFDGVDVGYTAIPSFVDIDGDGDQDAFIGEREGTIIYYENTNGSVATKDIIDAGIRIEVFPNPTSGQVEVHASSIEQIEILDIRGRLLRTVFSPTAILDISDIPNGMYFLKIKMENQFFRTQIVKSN